MKQEIKKGNEFKCILDYKMNITNEIAFKKGVVYKSRKNGTLPSTIDTTHKMDLDREFYMHFLPIDQSRANEIEVVGEVVGGNPYQELFNYLHDIFGQPTLDSEMQEIMSIVKKMSAADYFNNPNKQ